VTDPVIHVHDEAHVRTITLNRPEARNALNRALMYGLWDAVLEADGDDDIDAVVVTGADPAFSAGVDLKEVSGAVPLSAPARAGTDGPHRGEGGLYRFVPDIGKPIVAAVNGPCLTGGLEIALQCTFLVASERARFGDTHARVGIMPGGGLSVYLVEAVGWRTAVELSLTARFVEAAEALRLGLVNHVVPHEQLLTTAQGLAAEIATNDRRAVRRLFQHYRAIRGARLDDAQAREGLMAETWYSALERPAANHAEVIARGHDQLG
jgi:enoyl-CoA hydratase